MLHKESTLQSPQINMETQNATDIKQQKGMNNIAWVCCMAEINYYIAPLINAFPSDVTITEREGVYFKIKVSGEPQTTVTWYHDGEPVRADYAREIKADGSLAVPSTELKHSGVYKAVEANQHGSEEREVKLMINKEGDSSLPDRIIIGDTIFIRPIPILEFGKYVAELHADSNQHFKELYQVCKEKIECIYILLQAFMQYC